MKTTVYNALRLITALYVGLWFTFFAELASAQTQADYKLATDTYQSIDVVTDLKRRFGGQPERIYKTILQSYAIDKLSKAQALRCNGHLGVVKLGRSTVLTEQAIARDCPTLAGWILK